MEVNNPKYKNQGIHIIASIFTVEKGVTKVLLVKRKNEPFKDMWSLVGGALYNDERLEDGLRREIKEKTGIKDVDFDLYLCNVFDDINRSPLMRMLAVTYLGVIDNEKVSVLKETLKTTNAEWFPIDDVPQLAYDQNEILKDALNSLKSKIISSDILKSLFPGEFTIPEIQKVYESILEKKFDRRNFRKKLLNLNLIIDTSKYGKFEGRKPAKLYKFNHKIENKNVL